MKIEFTKAWCEQIAKRESRAGLSNIEAGSMPAANPSEAFWADSPTPIPLQTARHRSHAQEAENHAKQELEKL